MAAGDGLVLTGIRIVAAVRCAPPANKPTPAERRTCAAWLDRDLEPCGARLRVDARLGRIAWDADARRARGGSAGTCRGPSRGSATAPRPCSRTPADATVRLVGSYHVSQQNTFTGKLTEPMLDAVIARLRD